jgi:GntR family transcriptional regulator, rspAB operon transcriptional repressor
MENKNSNEKIYELVLDRILQLEYKPGEVIEEKKIAAEFNISRTPVRESLLRLSEKSMINMIPRIGTYVTQIDIKQVKNAYQVKKKLEAYATELASEFMPEDAIQKLLNLASEMETYDGSSDYMRYIAADYEFFKIIRQNCRNDLMYDMLEELSNIIVRFLRYIQYVCENPKWHAQSLNSIATSIKNRDAETAGKEVEYFDSVYVKKLFNTYFG